MDEEIVEHRHHWSDWNPVKVKRQRAHEFTDPACRVRSVQVLEDEVVVFWRACRCGKIEKKEG
jgi:hypothetical protein